MVTGSPTESADTTLAKIADTTVDVAGGVEVHATDSMDLNSTVSNVALNSDDGASAWITSLGGGAGLSASFVLSQTLRESDVLAELDTVTGTGVEGSVDVKAKDDADLYANVRLASESQVTNDGGVSVFLAKFRISSRIIKPAIPDSARQR